MRHVSWCVQVAGPCPTRRPVLVATIKQVAAHESFRPPVCPGRRRWPSRRAGGEESFNLAEWRLFLVKHNEPRRREKPASRAPTGRRSWLINLAIFVMAASSARRRALAHHLRGQVARGAWRAPLALCRPNTCVGDATCRPLPGASVHRRDKARVASDSSGQRRERLLIETHSRATLT